MLPLACVCLPVLGVLIVGLLGDYRYVGELRRMQAEGTLPTVVVIASKVSTTSARPAA
jgi:hypothetical protein